MGTVPLFLWSHLPCADNLDGLHPRRHQPVLPDEIVSRRREFALHQANNDYFVRWMTRAFQLFQAVYCPATLRHLESAQLICDLLTLPAPIPDSRLNSVDYGEFEARLDADLESRHEYLDTPYPGGESWRDCLARWHSFFTETLQKHDGQPVLLAGISGAGRRLCSHLCDGVDFATAVGMPRSGEGRAPFVFMYRF
jgi:broad specificity phosphatase PhoE